MSVATVVLPIARLRCIDGSRQAFCPNCDRKIGHIVGDRVVIAAGRIQLSCSAQAEPVMTCGRCGQASVLRLA